MKNLVLNIGLSLLVLFGFVSCNIKEDMSDCPGSMILDYSAYSDVILDDISDDEQIDVFIFDPNGICVDIYTFTYGSLSEMGLEFELPISYRGYNAVVWQGLNSENYTSNRMVLGESYDNFYMRIAYDTNDKTYSKVPDPLWASPLEPIDFCTQITRHRVYMTRLHTQINIGVQQKVGDVELVDIPVSELEATIIATNNVYHTDYDISEESIEIEYDNDYQLETISDSYEYSNASVGTLRITPDMECHLEVEYAEGKKISVGGNDYLDLVEYMLATKSDDTLSDQEFLDLNKVWNISFVVEEDEKSPYDYTLLSLVINGWVVWFSSEGLI